MPETAKLYKDQSGTLWRGPLYCGKDVFFATLDFVQREPILVPGFVDPLWKEVDQRFGMSLQPLNKFLKEIQLDINASLVERARHVAVQAHAGQTRWNGDAYVVHPIRVADSLTTDDEKVVGSLHDVVEDTDVTLVQLKSFGFTDEQQEAIDSVTKREGESYLDFVLRAKANPIGRRVKEADINDNLSDLDGKRHKHHQEKYQLALWILQRSFLTAMPPCSEGCYLL